MAERVSTRLHHSRKGTPLRLVTLAAAAVMVAGIMSSCGTPGSSGGATGGAGSPQQAVGNLLTALDQGQYGQAIDDLAPGESSALHEPLNQMVAQLLRLGVVAPGTSLSHIPGISFDFANPTYAVTNILPGVDFVTFTGGTETDTATPAQLPIGATIRSLLAPIVAKAKPVSKTSHLAKGSNAGLATIEVGGRWYVSLGYSVAEAVRRGKGLALPNPATAPAPAGDSSPNAAVRDLLESAASLNLTRLLALAPPDELAAVRTYSSLFLPKASAAISKLQGFSMRITGFSFTDVHQADGVLVKVSNLKVSGSVRGTQFTYANGCISVDSTAGVTVEFCKKDLSKLLADMHLPAAANQLVNLIEGLHPQVGLVTVSEGGKWYVSPTRTILDYADGFLASISSQQLQEAIRDIRQLVGSTHLKASSI